MLFCKAKVSNDGSTVIKENIGKFEIPMKIAPLSHLNETCYNIFHNFEQFLLTNSSFFLEKAAEIALITKLSDDIAM
jgi:hypothetical protein